MKVVPNKLQLSLNAESSIVITNYDQDGTITATKLLGEDVCTIDTTDAPELRVVATATGTATWIISDGTSSANLTITVKEDVTFVTFDEAILSGDSVARRQYVINNNLKLVYDETTQARDKLNSIQNLIIAEFATLGAAEAANFAETLILINQVKTRLDELYKSLAVPPSGFGY